MFKHKVKRLTPLQEVISQGVGGEMFYKASELWPLSMTGIKLILKSKHLYSIWIFKEGGKKEGYAHTGPLFNDLLSHCVCILPLHSPGWKFPGSGSAFSEVPLLPSPCSFSFLSSYLDCIVGLISVALPNHVYLRSTFCALKQDLSHWPQI